MAACNPLGDHYEDKASEDNAERVKKEAEDRRKAEPKELKRAIECKQCHSSIYDEWKRSMHSRSTAEGDPLYAQVKKLATESISQRLADQQCRKCHYAEWSQGEESAGSGSVGVTCTVCHEIAVGHPDKKLAGGTTAKLRRDHGEGGPQGLCLSCHTGIEFNEQPLCVTGMVATSDQGKCVDCHMGVADGPATSSRRDQTSHRAHDFVGGHNARFLRGAARIALERDGKDLVVKVKHGRAGHTVPTGNSMRHLVAVVEQFDADGKLIASNADSGKSPPLGKTPVFMRIYANDIGTRPVQPFQASGKPVDTRLSPGDQKEMRVRIAPKAKSAKAILHYYLAPQDLLRAAGLPIDPAPMSQAELSL